MKNALLHLRIPLAFYYGVTLGLPLANGAAGRAFLGHAVVVLTVPPVLIALFCAVRSGIYVCRRATSGSTLVARRAGG